MDVRLYCRGGVRGREYIGRKGAHEVEDSKQTCDYYFLLKLTVIKYGRVVVDMANTFDFVVVGGNCCTFLFTLHSLPFLCLLSKVSSIFQH